MYGAASTWSGTWGAAWGSPRNFGAFVEPNSSAWQAITLEIGIPTGQTRVVSGSGGYTYRQYADGRIEIIGYPGATTAAPSTPTHSTQTTTSRPVAEALAAAIPATTDILSQFLTMKAALALPQPAAAAPVAAPVAPAPVAEAPAAGLPTWAIVLLVLGGVGLLAAVLFTRK